MKPDVLGGHAGRRRVDRQRCEPERRSGAISLGHELDARKITKTLAIRGIVGTTGFNPPIQVGELGSTESGKQVGQSVVVSDHAVLIVRGGVTGLGGEPGRLIRPVPRCL